MNRAESYKKLLAELESGGIFGRPASLFALLYETPHKTQLEVARTVVVRCVGQYSMPEVHRRHLFTVLGDVAAWNRTEGLRVITSEEVSSDSNAAIESFYAAVGWLITGSYYIQSTFEATVTSCACETIVDSIKALGTDAWMRSDPEAYAAWENLQNLSGRSSLQNQAAIIVRKKEWMRVVKHLRRFQFERCAEISEPATCEAALVRWKEEGILTPPTYRGDIGM